MAYVLYAFLLGAFQIFLLVLDITMFTGSIINWIAIIFAAGGAIYSFVFAFVLMFDEWLRNDLLLKTKF